MEFGWKIMAKIYSLSHRLQNFSLFVCAITFIILSYILLVKKGESRAILFGFWASSCSWRVRAALHLKGIPFEEKSIDIVNAKTQLTDQYRDINPAQKVPALVIDGETLVESMAIIQYLDDIKPEPSLMPNTPLLRARAREICETVVSGIQPLQNTGLRDHFDTEAEYTTFTRYWADRGLQLLEEKLGKTAGRFCVGDRLSLADICVVPQVYNAVTRHKLDIIKYPTVKKLYETLLKEKIFQDTHPQTAKHVKMWNYKI